MKKILLILSFVFACSAFAVAQNFKFGYVNSTEIVMLMAETDSARANLNVAQQDAEETFQAMVEEYNLKLEQYQQKYESWTPAVRESKERELGEIQQRISDFQQSIQMELAQMEQNLMSPIRAKAADAINKVSKAKGLSVVFDITSLLYFDPAQGTDITKELKAELGIPEDKVLNTGQNGQAQ